ncbi:hypothetical protein Cs7R123_60950 [Catellatospora sp. TT07R-123]|uniref:hypothetical protein n=1 Tax=Catellatospora sp. TT07R-123 TaxID=2733863 RepID=UPI001B194BC6|nr:hypothetical protein [Catellatospora sp. TT07R-123]GHJ48753.1 hypothetical protein Cs7R123_60950 [Catellatospora sp. TT07R-123]
MNKLVDTLWLQLPAAMRRFWLTLGAITGDGAYLRAWPPLALVAPLGGFVLGAFLGLIHPGTVYTYSFFVVALMVLAAGAGSAVGLWTWSGYTLVDLVVTDRTGLPGFWFYGDPLDKFTTGYVPLVMSYLLLASLLVIAPLLGTGFAVRTAQVVRKSNADLALLAGQGVYVLVVAGYTYAWAHATPFMIRPLWSFAGQVPDTAAVQPIQSNTFWLAVFAGFAAVARSVAVLLAARKPVRPPAVAVAAPKPPGALPDVMRLLLLPAQALFVTLLLSGLVGNLFLGLVVWVLLTGILLLRVAVVPLIPYYPAIVAKVPLLVRIGVCVLFSYLSTSLIVQPFVDQGERSFTPLVVSIFLSFIVSVFLLPGPRLTFGRLRTPAGPAGPATTGGTAGTAAAAESVPPTLAIPTQPIATPPAAPPASAPAAPPAAPPAPPSAPVAGEPPAFPPPGTATFAARTGRRAAGFWARIVRRVAVLAAAAVAAVGVWAAPAFADNCSGLTDCSFGVKVALVVGAIALIALAVFLLPEILAAGAAEAAAIAAAEAAAEAAAAAAAEAAAEAAAVAAAEAAAAEAAAAAAAEAAAAEAAAAAAAEAAAAEAAAAEAAAAEAAAAEGAAAEGAAAEGAAAEGAAAGEGFSEEVMEQAYEYANTESKLAHIIDPAKHNLEPIVEAAGGRSEAMKALVDSLASGEGLPAAGRFEVTRIIEGATVTIRGAVVNGVPKIGTAFIP